MSNQFDASPEKVRNAEEKAKRRLFLRNEFLKQKYDPFLHASETAGTVFDSAMLRYQALHVSRFNFFKPTGWQALQGMLIFVIPTSLLTFCVYYTRTKKEGQLRRGEIAYNDRTFKYHG